MRVPELEQGPFIAAGRAPASPAFGGWGGAQVYLVALRGGPVLHLSPSQDPLRRVHVMVAAPGEAAEFQPPLSLLAALPGPPRRRRALALPPAEAGMVRPVRGEILWGEGGRFYERVGQRVVPLHHLHASPSGEVVEVLPPPRARFQPVPAEAGRERAAAQPEVLPPAEAPPAPQAAAGSSRPAALRPCGPEGGERRLVRWGDFAEQLRGQLAHAERLRPTHRLACTVQLHQVLRAERLEALAAELGLSPGAPGALRVLDGQAAALLGLRGLLREGRHLLPTRPRPPGVVLPRELVYQLQLEADPTADVEAPLRSEGATSAGAGLPAPRRAIPEEFLRPWDLELGREEALYEAARQALRPGLRGALRRLWRWLGARAELRRWRALLAGRPAEEQLWRVRPPRALLADPSIQGWARQVLATAGYDAEAMVPEWELYWRRKGR